MTEPAPRPPHGYSVRDGDGARDGTAEWMCSPPSASASAYPAPAAPAPAVIANGDANGDVDADADRHVDEEDPVPVEQVREHASE